MITSIEISHLRGIREGKLENLTPLTILVGPNGSGKSTVLDAVLIGASANVGEGIGRAVLRHSGITRGSQWLHWRAEHTEPAMILVETSAGSIRRCVLSHLRPNKTRCVTDWRIAGDAASETVDVDFSDSEHGKYDAKSRVLADVRSVKLVESIGEKLRPPLHALLTVCSQRGQRAEVVDRMRQVVPAIKDVLILTEGETPIVHIEYPSHSVPAALSGDGIHSLLRVCLELAAGPNEVVLLEEPETHQHPAAMHQTVRGILAAVRRGAQVIFTTHSMELIDSFVAQSDESDLDKLSLFRLGLHEGKLISVRVPGKDVAFARGEIERDLR